MLTGMLCRSAEGGEYESWEEVGKKGGVEGAWII